MIGRRRIHLALFAIVMLAGLGGPALVARYQAALGPLALDTAQKRSPVVLDRDGVLLRAFTTADGLWRLPVSTRDVDPRFLAMLLAFEDRRFATHRGIDWRAMARAAGQYATHGRVVSGGSTLTMQVARLLEPRPERSLAAKLRQIVRARQIEARFDKTAILDLYLALAPYGGNLEGVRAASLAYFGREPRRLTIAQAALLVALPQSPETRRPDRFAEAARAARARVLDRVAESGVITQAEATQAKAESIPAARQAFPAIAPHAAEAALARTPDAVSVRLTLDVRLQTALQNLARDAAERLGPKLSVAILAVDNASGEIRAHVGGADYFSTERAGSLDLTQAIRSPGSALKPFIYELAFENGLAHPETLLNDRPQRYGVYAPENFDLTFQGQVSARRALQNSLNVPAIALLAAVGPARFLARLRNAGATLSLASDTAPGLAVGLGGLGISLTDMVRLYAGLAQGGRVPPLVERGDVPVAGAELRIADPVSAWYVADILRGAPPPDNAPYGQISFKTGTSYGYRDAFAVGFDRRTTIGVWVGRADNAPVPGLVGRQVAAPILFDAFARLGGTREPVAAPPGILVASNTALPPPLRRLKTSAPASAPNGLKIAFPPDGALVDVGAKAGAPGLLALKAQGGAPPFTWIVNGAPVAAGAVRREAEWRPDGAGFARLSVIDATGATDSVAVRVE